MPVFIYTRNHSYDSRFKNYNKNDANLIVVERIMELMLDVISNTYLITSIRKCIKTSRCVGNRY